MITIEVLSADELVVAFINAEDALPVLLRRGIRRATNVVAAQARRNAPVGDGRSISRPPGRIKRTTRSSVRNFEGRVRTTATSSSRKYAAYPYPLRITFEGRSGGAEFGPRDYTYRALEEKRDDVQEIIDAEVIAPLERAFSGR